MLDDSLDLAMSNTLERFPQPLQPYLDISKGPAQWTCSPPLRQLQDLEALYCYFAFAGTVRA